MRVRNLRLNLLRWLGVLLVSGGLAVAGPATPPALASEGVANSDAQVEASTSQQIEQASEASRPPGQDADEIDAKAGDATAQQRDRVIADAVQAIADTRRAVTALEEDDVDAALKALEAATGKLELIMARRPELALAPIDVRVVQSDLYATPEDVTDAVKQARDLLGDGELQEARLLVANLASEVVVETVNLPLATYPDAIKAAVPLIDRGDLEAGQRLLENALSTLIVRTEAVIPVPIVRAQELLAEADELAKTEDRSDEQNARLAQLLEAVRTEIELAERLDYGDDEQFEKLYAQLRTVEKKTEGGQSGKGFFDSLDEQLSALLPF